MNATLTQDHLDYYLEIAQREIAFCQNCQPSENGKRVWRWGIAIKMSDLLTKLDIPQAEHEYLAESLECNNCGALLDRTTVVGVKSRNARELEQLWRKWETQFANRFRDFHEFLAEYPTLGIQHRLGRQFLKGLGELPRTEMGTAVYFCARRLTNGLPPTVEDFELSPHEPRSLRYQHAGQQTLLLTDSEAGAAREILAGAEKVVWLQKFQLTRCKGILDLSHLLTAPASPLIEPLVYGLYYHGALKPGEVTASEETACRVSRFLVDCARLHGCNGIRTKSTKHHANNLILFARPEEVLLPQGEPYLFDLRSV